MGERLLEQLDEGLDFKEREVLYWMLDVEEMSASAVVEVLVDLEEVGVWDVLEDCEE